MLFIFICARVLHLTHKVLNYSVLWPVIYGTLGWHQGNGFLVLNQPLLLLSHFSRVRLCATTEMAAHQAPPSLGFSSKNTGVGCHFLLQCTKVKSESEVAESCPTLSDPMHCGPTGSSVHEMFQARLLEWGATAFSESASTHPQSPLAGVLSCEMTYGQVSI